MNNINCFTNNCLEMEIKPNCIESMRLRKSENILPEEVKIVHKGETYYDGWWFFKKKKVAEHTFYKWNEHNWIFTRTPQVLVSELRENLNEYDTWKRYFDIPKQVEYNQMADCVMRKPTIIIRTKSGETLFAVCNTNLDAEKIIHEFNKL